MTMRTRQLLVGAAIAVLAVWAILVLARPADTPVASEGPSPTGGIGSPASTSIPSASAAASAPAATTSPSVAPSISEPTPGGDSPAPATAPPRTD